MVGDVCPPTCLSARNCCMFNSPGKGRGGEPVYCLTVQVPVGSQVGEERGSLARMEVCSNDTLFPLLFLPHFLLVRQVSANGATFQWKRSACLSGRVSIDLRTKGYIATAWEDRILHPGWDSDVLGVLQFENRTSGMLTPRVSESVFD